jgi:hypothetical protein
LPWYSWNIVESGIKTPKIKSIKSSKLIFINHNHCPNTRLLCIICAGNVWPEVQLFMVQFPVI